MGVAAQRAPVGAQTSRPPQKFGHGPYFIGKQLSETHSLFGNEIIKQVIVVSV